MKWLAQICAAATAKPEAEPAALSQTPVLTLRPCCSPPSQEAHFHVFTIGLNSCLRETSRVLVNEHVQSLVLMPNKLFHFEYLPAWWRWRNPLKDRLPLSFRTLHAQKTIDWDFQKYLPVSPLWDFHSAGLSSLVLSQSLPYSGTKVFAGKRHEKGISILPSVLHILCQEMVGPLCSCIPPHLLYLVAALNVSFDSARVVKIPILARLCHLQFAVWGLFWHALKCCSAHFLTILFPVEQSCYTLTHWMDQEDYSAPISTKGPGLGFKNLNKYCV